MSLTGNAQSGYKLRGKLSGLDTIRGYSAYEVAVINGFKGTEEEWLESLKGEPGTPGKQGKQGNPGKDGRFEDLTAEQKESLRGYPGKDGEDGQDGNDGVSPSVSVSTITGGKRVSITDKSGTKNFDVMDGKDGEKGDPGYTPQKGKDYFDGSKGDPGYTPKKGVDYFDGQDGEDGVSVTHAWNGTRLRITSASGTSEVDLKGDPGTGITILGSYDTVAELRAAHATGNPGDGYMVGGDLYVWSEGKNDWDNVGRIKGDPGEDGYTPVKGVDYFDGKDGYTPKKGVDYFDGEDGYTPVKGKDYFDGNPGAPGADGVSPTVSVAAITGGHRITITDKNGTKSVDVMDGAAGAPGSPGSPGTNGDDGVGIASIVQTTTSNADGGSNVFTVTLTNGTHATFTVKNGSKGSKGEDGYTPVKGTDYFDGKDGQDGQDGYTPQKGVDYFDGKDGENGKDGQNGVSATHSWNGTVLTVTSASGSSSADLKGAKGDPYTLNDTDKNTIAAAVKASLNKENWTFTLEDGTTVTKAVYIGELPPGVKITTKLSGSATAISSSYLYVEIDGVKYTSATEMPLPVGTVIHCFAVSGIYVNGTSVGTINTSDGTYTYDYTLTGAVAIELDFYQPQGRPNTSVRITEL